MTELDDEWSDELARVATAVRELLADGPSSIGEIASELRERDVLAPFGITSTGSPVGGVDLDGSDQRLVAFVDEVLFDIDETWRAFDGTVVLTDRLLDGLVFTHRVTADELERGVLDATPDLSALTFIDVLGAPFAGGGTITLRDGLDDAERFAATGSYEGPPGWLDGVTADSVVALRRDGDVIHLLTDVAVPPVDASSPEVVALGLAFDGLTEPGDGVEHDLVVVGAATIEPRAFREPTAPVADLLGPAGLRSRGVLVGPIDAEFEAPGQRARRERLDEIAQKYQLDDCCRQALDHVLDEWAEHRRRALAGADTAGAAPADADAVPGAADVADGGPDRGDAASEGAALPDGFHRHLLHGAVAPAFAEFVLDGSYSVSLLASFARRIVAAGGPAAGTGHHLVGLAELRRSSPVEALAAFETAVRLDGPDSLAAADHADLVTDTGDLGRALSLWRRVPSAPAAANHIAALSSLFARYGSTGRNDPCPCGSGRKYKQCCERSPKLTTADRRRIALHQVGAFAAREQGRDLFALALTADGAVMARDERDREYGDDVDDERSWDEQVAGIRRWIADPFLLDVLIHEGLALDDYLDQRGDLVPEDERTWLELVASSARSLWHVERIGADRAHVRHLFSDTEFADVVIGTDIQPAWRGGVALARFLPDGPTGESGFVGVVVPVPPGDCPVAVHMVDDDPGPDELVAWYALDFDRPDLAPLRGDPFPPTTARFAPVDGDWDATFTALDERFDRVPADDSGEPEWRATVDTGHGGPVTLASLRREPAERGERSDDGAYEGTGEDAAREGAGDDGADEDVGEDSANDEGGDELVVRVHSMGRLAAVRDTLDAAGIGFLGAEPRRLAQTDVRPPSTVSTVPFT